MELSISTWNLTRKSSPEEVDKIIFHSSDTKLKESTPHIVCIQQANLPPDGYKLRNYKWLCSGKFGSAVLINKASDLKEGLVEQVCEEICVTEVTKNGVAIKIISCYIPPSTNYVTQDLWAKLEEILKAIPPSVTYVLAGDFNAEIGKDDVFPGLINEVIGQKLCHKVSNKNGLHLKNLALHFHMRIVSTYGKNNSVDVHTYKGEKEKSQRSFILIPSERFNMRDSNLLMRDCKYSWYTDFNSALLSKNIVFRLHEDLKDLHSSPLTLSSWNVHGASTSAVDKVLNDLDLPVVCVQDVFLTSDDDIKTNHYTWFASKKLWGKNVGILVKNGSNISLTDFTVVSESLCVGTVTGDGSSIKVICCSIPPYTDTAKFQEVTESLICLVQNIPEETLFAVAGDFNTNAFYSMLEDKLVFDNEEGNVQFLQNLLRKCAVDIPQTPRFFFTQVSEKVKRNSNLILMSSNCADQYYHKETVLWVPLFENGIVVLYCCISDEERCCDEGKSENVEHNDGFIYVTERICKIKNNFAVSANETQAYRFYLPEELKKQLTVKKSDLPDEIVEKYKSFPPPLDELLRILGDGFTLYFGFTHESLMCKGFVNMLTDSFEYLKRGPLLLECVNVCEETTKSPVKRLIRLRWNGIVVHQYEGRKFVNYMRIIFKAQSEFIGKLGQHYFTVKARPSYYNKGLPPLCDDKDKLGEEMRVIKRTDFPPSATMEDLKCFINDFISKKPHYEIVFGPDFDENNKFLDPIRKYVQKERNQRVRTFKSREGMQNFDHVGIFINRNPKEIRNKLMKIPEHQDLRFQLFPPCGTDKDYFEWIDEWTEKTIPDEYFKPYEALMETESSSTNCNGSTEETINPNTIEEESKTKKRDTGYVHKVLRKVGNAKTHRLMKCTSLISGNYSTARIPSGSKNWAATARTQSDLAQKDVNKYRLAPPNVNELTSILGDNFTLYYGFTRDSSVASSSLDILAESFEALGRGGIMVEHILVLHKGQQHSRLVKFIWNGICIHNERGGILENFKNITTKGEAALIDLLGQHYYAVKAKITYFNNGALPQCPDKEKLTAEFKIVEEHEIPCTDETRFNEIKKFAKVYLRIHPDVELVFGPEFKVMGLLEPFKKFASSSKEYGIRYLKIKEDATKWDSIGMFIKRSPLQVRDKLMNIPDHQDLKFFLVPPCEFFDKSHNEWIKSWAAENCNDEFKLITEHEKNAPKPSSIEQKLQTAKRPAPGIRNEQRASKVVTKPRTSGTRGGRREITLTEVQPREIVRPRPEYSRSARRGGRALQRNETRQREKVYPDYPKPGQKRDRQQMNRDYQREIIWSQPAAMDRDYQRESIRSQFAAVDRDYQRDHVQSQPAAMDRDYQRESIRSHPAAMDRDYQRESIRSQPAAMDRDYQRENVQSQPATSTLYYERQLLSDNYPAENFQPQSSGSDLNYDRQQMDSYNRDNFLTKSSRSRLSYDQLVDLMDEYYKDSTQSNVLGSGASYDRPPMEVENLRENSYSHPSESGNYYNQSGRQEYDNQLGRQEYSQPESYVPQRKRARQEVSLKVDKPRWDDIAPLLIVWPINIRSEPEKDSRKVLEANFPTEISLESNNRVAVYVTLPLHNRREKKYCLTVGDGVNNAARTALDIIVKHSSIIKYNVNFLPPDGQIPNFIRYNIPCQTNPRTYITLNWMDTGPLTKDKLNELFDSFKISLNEDLFFDRNYSHEMKLMILDLAPKHRLKVRHFGEEPKLVDRYVCVYKTKPKDEVLEEVLKMRDFHPKYKLVANKLPPRLGLNIF